MIPTEQDPGHDDLVAREGNLARQADELRRAIEAKQAELAGVEERLNLVRKLIELETRGGSLANPDGVATSSDGSASPAEPSTRVKGAELEESVAEILRTAGQPLHVSDIRAALVERRVPIPGRGDDANIIVRLRRNEDRFTRTARGTYALAEWGLEPLATRKRRRRKATR